ncbi:unnamed protein product [Danaus chrysippus]|uniref:(African queen) hypothetical protein n=1 Tax=Danaus chrysippus TaxID=151541 RepID=A0A8J2R9Z8_9NEOP|nr:unnamed protein product [Danaus chrysippus]
MPPSLERPLALSKNGGILTMQVVYETCLTRIEKKKVAGKFAYNSIPRSSARPRPAPVCPPAPHTRAPLTDTTHTRAHTHTHTNLSTPFSPLPAPLLSPAAPTAGLSVVHGT